MIGAEPTSSNDPRPRYREIEVAGTPRQLGQAIGEATREEIREFVHVALERVRLTAPISTERAYETVARCLPMIEAYASDQVEEMRGTAAAAGVDLRDIVLLQVRNQFLAEAEAGCTSICLARPMDAEGRGDSCVVGQNWDNDPALDPFTVVLTRRPVGKPAVTTLTQAGLIAYIGFNDRGIGVCLNTLPAPSRSVGVPHYATLRALYETGSLEDAAAAIRKAERAIPANLMLATPQGPADLEVTLDDVRVLTAADQLTHTNHCLHDELLPINSEFPELIQSGPRLARVNGLLASSSTTGVAAIQTALRDHDNYPRSICRHANDDPQTGFWETVFSVVIDPTAREMHVSRGTPCRHPYQRYRMS